MDFSTVFSSLFSLSFFPFGFALVLALCMLIVEGLSTLFNIQLALWAQHYLPGLQSRILKMLGVEHVSLINVFILFLVNFSLIGYFLQMICYAISGNFMNPVLLLMPVFVLANFLSISLVHWRNQLQSRLPEEIPEQPSLLGRVATISSHGSAKPGASADAIVRDHHGKLYHVQVEPEYGELTELSEVILFAQEEDHYLAKLLPNDDKRLNYTKT